MSGGYTNPTLPITQPMGFQPRRSKINIINHLTFQTYGR